MWDTTIVFVNIKYLSTFKIFLLISFLDQDCKLTTYKIRTNTSKVLWKLHFKNMRLIYMPIIILSVQT